MKIGVVHGYIITIRGRDSNYCSKYTLGVCPLTLPARAKDPWTFPPSRGTVRSTVRFSRAARLTSSSRGEPEQNRFNCKIVKFEMNISVFFLTIYLFAVHTLEHG